MSIERDQKAIVNRITEQMEKQNLDAILLTSGDGVFYATGYADNFLYRTGHLGTSAAIVTRDGKTGLVVSEFACNSAKQAVKDVEIAAYPTWIYIDDYAIEGMTKEVQPDLNKTYRIALQFLPENKADIRLGIQPSSLTHAAWSFLADVFGENNLVSIDSLLVEARAIKTPWEIELIRTAAHYSELTMNKVAKLVVPGMTEADVVQLFNTIGFSWSPDIVSVSNAHTIGENFTPSYIHPHTRINRGDIIRLDGGPNYKGYNSDLARTFAVGGETAKNREELYAHLWAGYEFAINNIGPGVKMSSIFNGIHELLKKRGFNNYIRGHQGHSLGCGQSAEEYPFIAPDENRIFEPGMTINIELPYYSSKNQTYNIEDTFLITETGIELFSKASPSLYV